MQSKCKLPTSDAAERSDDIQEGIASAYEADDGELTSGQLDLIRQVVHHSVRRSVKSNLFYQE